MSKIPLKNKRKTFANNLFYFIGHNSMYLLFKYFIPLKFVFIFLVENVTIFEL